MDYRAEYVERVLGVTDVRKDLLHTGSLDDTSPTVVPPAWIKSPLKAHQLAAMYRMAELETGNVSEGRTRIHTRMGVLCDSVGSGKTITMLAMLGIPLDFPDHDLPRCMDKQIAVYEHTDMYERLSVDVVVVPHGIAFQWQEAFERFTDFRVYKITRRTALAISPEDLATYDVVLVSNTFYKHVYDLLMGYMVRRFVVDEADTINLGRVHAIKSAFTWFITSSVGNVMYPHGRVEGRQYLAGMMRNGFCKDAFVSIETSLYASSHVFVRSKDDFIKGSFRLPEPEFSVIRCKTPIYLTLIDSVVGHGVLESLNAGDVDTAVSMIDSMGMNVGTGSHVVDVVSERFRTRLENLEHSRRYVEAISLPTRERESRLAKIDDDIHRTEESLAEVQKRILGLNGEMCAICYDEPKDPRALLQCCNHVFCYACIGRMIEVRPGAGCPMCRSPIKTERLHVMTDTVPNKRTPRKTKDDTALEILAERAPQGRVLVFSNYERSLETIEQRMIRELPNIPFARAVGNSAHLQRVIRSYREGTIRVLLLNSRHHATGLNLPETTDVVFYHSMDDDLERQVVGRAQRMGRTGALRVTHLLHDRERDHRDL